VTPLHLFERSAPCLALRHLPGEEADERPIAEERHSRVLPRPTKGEGMGGGVGHVVEVEVRASVLLRTRERYAGRGRFLAHPDDVHPRPERGNETGEPVARTRAPDRELHALSVSRSITRSHVMSVTRPWPTSPISLSRPSGHS